MGIMRIFGLNNVYNADLNADENPHITHWRA